MILAKFGPNRTSGSKVMTKKFIFGPKKVFLEPFRNRTNYPDFLNYPVPDKQSLRNLVENINAASRRKQRIYSAPSMCCEEKKEHFSPSSEHRHVSSHRVAFWFCPNQTLLHSRISHIQVKGIVNWILNMGQSYSKAWLWLSSYIQIRRFWICLCIVKVIFRF